MENSKEKLNNLRLRLGLTINEMAEGIGMSKSVYQRHLYGNRELKTFEIYDICEIFQVDPRYFTEDMPLEEAVKNSPLVVNALAKDEEAKNTERKNRDLNASRKAAGDRIKERRKELGLTQTALAKAAGVPQPSIAGLEKQSRQLGTLVAQKLAPVLEVSPVWLLYGEEELPESIGGQILRIRQEQGITLKRLTELTGLPQGTISKIEKGYTPTEEQAEKIMAALRQAESAVE